MFSYMTELKKILQRSIILQKNQLNEAILDINSTISRSDELSQITNLQSIRLTDQIQKFKELEKVLIKI